MSGLLTPVMNQRFLPRISAKLLAAVLMTAVAVPVLGASAAHADTGRSESGQIRLSWSSVVSYRNLDPADPRHSQALLDRVEAEVHKLCDGDMVRSDRRACEKSLIAAAMNSVSEPVRSALAQAQAGRNEVAQAMR